MINLSIEARPPLGWMAGVWGSDELQGYISKACNFEANGPECGKN